MKNYVINEELANAVFSYLSQRSYREVAGLMAGLGQLPEAELPKVKAEEIPDAE